MKIRLIILFGALLGFSAAATGEAETLPLLHEKGIVLDHGAMGKFLLEYPLYGNSAGKRFKPQPRTEGRRVVITYP